MGASLVLKNMQNYEVLSHVRKMGAKNYVVSFNFSSKAAVD
jgi:hypothetical protein